MPVGNSNGPGVSLRNQKGWKVILENVAKQA